MDSVIRDAIEIAARALADRESEKLDKMIMKPRSDTRPHPYWAKHAMRFKGNDDATLLKCRSDAEMNCPADLSYAIREVNGDLEWYAPISPK